MLKMADILKNRKIMILLCVELLLVLLGAAGLFGKRGVVAGAEDARGLLTEGISLPPGVYTARLYYETQEDKVSDFGVTVEEQFHHTLLCNYSPLYMGINMRECQFYLLDSVEGLRVEVEANGASTLEVKGAEIVAGTQGSLIFLFWVLLISIPLDGFCLLSLCHKKSPLPAAKQRAVFGVSALALLSSLPVMVDYSIIGADLVFHLMRIEALAEHIRRGEIFSRIESVWLAGHGYANSVFYGDTFLTVPALLRLMGFSPDSAYRMFVALVNLATAWISYVCFRKCFRSRDIGLLGSALYTLSPYRIYNIYNRAAVGEYTAMIFFPLLAWGFYKIYTEDPDRKGYLWNWVIPTVGFSGIIQSHTLSCEMAGGVVLLLCLLLWRKTFRRRIFTVLSLTVVMTSVLNAWFLTPFLDLMAADQYFFGHNADVLVQDRGVLPAHLFYTLQAAGASSRFADTGMIETEPIGIGAALLLCMGLWLWLRAKHGRETLTKEQRTERRAADVALLLGWVVLFMSTNLFPWDFLSSCNRLFATLNGSLQFPTRLTGVATVCMVVTACVMGKWVFRESWGAVPGVGVLTGLSLVAALFGTFQLNDTLLTRQEFIRLYSAQNIGHSAVLGAEYLPEGVDINHMSYHAPVPSEGVELVSYEKKGLSVRAYVEASQRGSIDFPMLCYKGYEARVQDTGERLAVEKGENSDVRVLFPKGFSGEIRVSFKGAWYWHLAEAVSAVSAAGLLGWYVWTRIAGRKNKNEKNSDYHSQRGK